MSGGAATGEHIPDSTALNIKPRQNVAESVADRLPAFKSFGLSTVERRDSNPLRDVKHG